MTRLIAVTEECDNYFIEDAYDDGIKAISLKYMKVAVHSPHDVAQLHSLVAVVAQ